MIKSPINMYLKNSPKSNHSNYFTHQSEAKTYSRHQDNPMFHLPKQYYNTKKKFQQSLSTKYYSHNPNSQNNILITNQHHNDSIQSQHSYQIKINNWNQSTKTKENINQLRSSLESLEKMIEKSQQILRSTSKKSFVSNIKQTPTYNNNNKNKLHAKVRSDSINLKLKTEGSIGSSIQSKKDKKSAKYNYNINIPNQISQFNRGALHQKNNSRNLFVKENQQSLSKSKNVKRKLIFNPESANSKIYANANIKDYSHEKPRHILSFQKASKDKKFDTQYQFYFNNQQEQNQNKKYKIHQKSQSSVSKKSHKKKLINLTIDITPQEIDFNNDKIVIQNGRFSPINKKPISPTAFSSISGWNTSFHNTENNYSANHQYKLSHQPSFGGSHHNQNIKAEGEQSIFKKKIKLKKTPKQNQNNYSYKIQKQFFSKPIDQNNGESQSIKQTYFTGKNLPQYYKSNYLNKKNKYQKISLGSQKGKYSILNKNNNIINKQPRHNRIKSYLSTNYYTNQHQKSSRSKNNSYDKKSSPCKKYERQNQNYKRQHFVKKVQKYAFVEKYLSQRQIISIYEGLKKTNVPQSKWILQVIDQVYKKMQKMNKSIH